MEQIISIGSRLREVREEMQKTQSDFAAIASFAGVPGATRQSQAKYEKGHSSPGAAYLSAIGEAGADVLYILTGRKELQRHQYPALIDDFRFRLAAHSIGENLWKIGITPEKLSTGKLREAGFDSGQRIWLMTLIRLAVGLYNSTEWLQGDDQARENMARGMVLSESLRLSAKQEQPTKS